MMKQIEEAYKVFEEAEKREKEAKSSSQENFSKICCTTSTFVIIAITHIFGWAELAKNFEIFINNNYVEYYSTYIEKLIN